MGPNVPNPPDGDGRRLRPETRVAITAILRMATRDDDVDVAEAIDAIRVLVERDRADRGGES